MLWNPFYRFEPSRCSVTPSRGMELCQVYLGPPPGVGKCYAMFEEGAALQPVGAENLIRRPQSVGGRTRILRAGFRSWWLVRPGM